MAAQIPFTTRTISTTASGAFSVFALDVDVDVDGDIDVLSAATGRDKIDWYENLSVSVGLPPETIEESFSHTKPPPTFSLGPIYPNPFNPSTTIQIAIPYAAEIEL